MAAAASVMPGARESSAGDDFHVLWATRRVLGLLDPRSKLESVVMEDLHPAEPAGSEPALLLGVDLTEYFGGRDLASADRVIVSQLKYSHRNPDRAWTAARLAERRGRRPSVMRRLADIYSAFRRKHPRERVLPVLRIRLISNRPMGEKLGESLRAAKAELDRHPGKISMATLIDTLATRHHEDLQRLREASGLQSHAFTDFLRLFELRGGEGTREEQELEITAALGAHVKADLAHHTRALYDFVRRAGLPNGGPIGVEDVLAALGAHNREQLFPAPGVFSTRPSEIVETPDPARVVEALHATANQRLIAHGNAGVGKTTTALRLGKHLPKGSVVVAVDCFAGGDYLRPAHSRHLPERAVLQLCNELAVNCRLPLLIVPPKSAPDLWLELERRLQAAAETMSGSGAEVVIVIDAADNAAWAARKRSDPSFVPDIWQLKIPPGAGLIVTARSGRRDSLEAPNGIDQVELMGFDEVASAAYLRMRFPDAEDEECAEFHRRSQGNPRVQSYVLGLTEMDSVTAAVELAQRTPRDIFDDLWSAAVEQAPDPDWATERLADLMCLTPPITLERLADVAGCGLERVQRFCHALVPGLRVEPGAITIQDEDFERFLEDEKLDASQRRSANSRLADFFAARQGDPYAAMVLVEHLLGAERLAELVELAVEGGPPEAIADPLARLQVYTRRLRLALKSAAAPQDRLTAAKLLVLAARAANSDSAVTEVIRLRPELALRYGESAAVAAVWRQDRNLNWQGPVHMRLAALRAREGAGELAQSELRSANAWLELRGEDDNYWEMDESDLAAAIEAVYLLQGADAAFAAIRHWRPWSFVWKVTERFIARLGRSSPIENVAELVFEARLPAQMKARLLVGLGARRNCIPAAQLRALAREVARSPIRPAHRTGSWPIDFVEMVALASGDRRLVLRLLWKLKPPLPRHAPNRWERLGNFRDPLRWAALRALCDGGQVQLEELMPESTEDSDPSRASSERENMRESVGPFVEIYSRRAAALLKRPRADNAGRSLRKYVEAVDERSRFRWFKSDQRFAAWIVPMCDILLAASGSDRVLVKMAADVVEAALGEGDVATWASMAKRLVGDPRYRDQALVLVDRAARRSEGRPQRASELADTLVDLAEIADPYDPRLAADLYNRAVAAAEGLDDRGVAALETHARVASGLAGHDQAPLLGQRIAAAVIAYVSRVSEDRYLPWQQTLEAITTMHPSTGFAVAARWEDRRVIRLQESIGWVTTVAVEAGFLDPDDGLSLLFLNGEGYERTRASLAILDRLVAEGDRTKLAAALEHVSLIVRRDMGSAARVEGCEALKRWAAENGLASSEAVSALDPYILAKEEPEEVETPRFRKADDADLEALMANADRCKAEHLAEQLNRVVQLSLRDETLMAFLTKVGAAQPPGERVALLEAVAALPTDQPVMRFHGKIVITFLDKALAEWSSAPIRNWRAEKLRTFLAAQLPNFVRYPESAGAQLTAIARLLGDEETAELAIEGAALNIDALGPESLHTLAAHVASTLSPDQAVEFLDWSLRLLDLEIESADPISTEKPVDVLAGLLWAQFGNPEKQVRWRTAHAARRMIGSGRYGAELAAALLECAGTRQGGEFADPRLEFLWFSAQIWVHMTLARIAGDNPEVLADEAAGVRDVAISGEWPHAAVREFARRASFRIADSIGAGEEELRALELANRPAACFTPRGDRYKPLTGVDRDAARWSFDMDTESYWFGPLGRVFRVGVGEVAQRAEKWLIDTLGESPERSPWRGDPRIAERDYMEVSHHHGSLPRLENSGLALEYAAMHLVAGELIDERRAVVVENYEPVVDPWLNWLGSHLEERQESWMVDLRAPTPAEPELLDVKPENGAWPRVGEGQLLMLLGHPGPRCLAIDAYMSYRSGAGWGSDSLHSALVEPATAPSLVRAMETAEYVSFFPFPLADENDEVYGNAIDEPPFRLLGWLSDHDREREGIERDDPLARISAGCVLPSTGFIEHHGASVCRKTRRIIAADGTALAWVRAFSDHPPAERERYEGGFSAAGQQTFVRTDALLGYLRTVGMVLVIKAEMTRRGKSDQRPGEANEQEVQKVLIIEGNGTVKGLRGCRSLG